MMRFIGRWLLGSCLETRETPGGPLFDATRSRPRAALRSLFCGLAITLALSAMPVAAVAAGPEKTANPGPAPAKPNIVFIIADDLGNADLGCFGSKQVQTPHIDRLAAEGMRFTQAYSGCTVCAPARSVLMTGYHAGHTSVRSNSGGVPLLSEDVTVAEVLKKAGYTCGGFGKWGLGDVQTSGVPEQHGFDVFFGYYHQVHAHNYYPDYLWRNSRKVPLPGNAKGRQQYSHYLIFEEMLKFIRQQRDRPFFCYAPWTPPHGICEIPEDDPAWQLYQDKPWPKEVKLVAAMDTMLDRHVGQVIELLKELQLERRTIVFFCSDNGTPNRREGTLDSAGPLRGTKGTMYEGGIRVPMIVCWPGIIKAGAVSEYPWTFQDFMPTAAELAGADPPQAIDGISILPTLLGEEAARRKQARHDFFYWELPRGDFKKGTVEPNSPMQAVRLGDWKGVRPKGGAPLELYDLARDVGETKNLAGEHPEIVARLEAILKTCRSNPRPQQEPEKPAGQRFR